MGINFNTVTTPNFFQTGVVSGQELTQVSQEIFSASALAVESTSTTLDYSKARQVDAGLLLTGANAQVDSSAARQAAGVDVNVTGKAASAISALNAQAALLSAVKMASQQDGKVYIPFSTTELTDLKNTFSTQNVIDLNKAQNLDKDKQGASDSFLFSNNKNNQAKEDKLDLTI